MKRITIILCVIAALVALVIWLFRVFPTANLAAAVRSRDPSKIANGFDELVYRQRISGARIRALIAPYLSDPNPRVRYEAAKSLYAIGDDRGFAALIALVESPNAIADGSGDLRRDAAGVLAKHRQYRALDAMISLHIRGAGGLLPALITLRDPDIISKLEQQGFVQNRFSILNYGRTGVMSFQSQIRQVFQSSSDHQMKVAAAFALFRFTGEDRYVAYLISEAMTAFTPGAASAEGALSAVQCLGSIDSPHATEFLESLLLKKNNVLLIRTALVNLVMNQQKPSAKGLGFVLSELAGTMEILGADLTLNIAAQLSDPRFDAAGRKFDRQSESSSWHLYAVERKSWSNYNWIDDYVLDLKSDHIARP